MAPIINALEPRRIFAAALLIAAACNPALANAAWTTRERVSGDPPGSLPIAAVTQHSRALEVQLDGHGDAWLQFNIASSDPAFASSQCPTFQIDQQLQLIHFSIGESCVVTAAAAKVKLGHRTDPGVLSPALYALVNGNRIAVRYITHERRYREVSFSLRHAKRAVRKALGGRQIRSR